MPDREKVIAMLERYMRIPNLAGAENYGAKIVNMPAPLITDALALLKAQEPVKPTLDIRHGKSMWRCGTCSTALQPNQMHAKFCFNCGRAVKWDG